jgi:peptidoglycan/xylan/chitin deacetylase (PgdA/CDA1 family)
MLKVTTSWDDGDVLDQRVAGILEKNGLKGAFYIPQVYGGRRLTDSEIKELSQKHEIGAHTLKHAELNKVSLDEARDEIVGSKEWVESITGKSCEMFCYPKGLYTEAVALEVEKAGFKGARTVKQFSLSIGKPFEMETTIHVYPMPFRYGAGPRRFFGPIKNRYSGYRSLGANLWDMRSFETAAKAAFDTALKRGGVFHVWGHSWEIERHGLWQQFENLCAHMANRKACEYVTNGELV